MRVPPEVLSTPKKWQLPAVTLLLALSIIAVGIFSGLDTRAVVTQSNRVKKVQIVVAHHRLWPGEVFEKTNLVLEVRDIENVPEGTVRTLEELIGKRAAAEIAEGTPITDWLMASPDEIKPLSELFPPEPSAPEVSAADIPVTILDAEAAKQELLGH